MDSGVTEDYLSEIDNEIQIQSSKLLSGHCATFDEYKHISGIIRGLRVSKEILQDTVAKALAPETLEQDTFDEANGIVTDTDAELDDEDLDMEALEQVYPGIAG